MIINTKIRYGIRTLIEIGLSEDAIYQKDISENQDISLKYLDHIISGLKKAKLIKNFSVKRSGYILAKPASKISILDIFKAFDDNLIAVDCKKINKQCNKHKHCAVKEFWDDFESDIENKLSKVYLNELIEKQKKLN